jgi:hypothetical protein
MTFRSRGMASRRAWAADAKEVVQRMGTEETSSHPSPKRDSSRNGPVQAGAKDHGAN